MRFLRKLMEAPIRLLALSCLLLCLTIAPLSAAGEEEALALERFQTNLEDVTKSLKDDDLNDERLKSLRDTLEEIRTDALLMGTGLAPEVVNAETRLKQLGEAPEDGGESEALAAERKNLQDEFARLLELQKRR